MEFKWDYLCAASDVKSCANSNNNQVMLIVIAADALTPARHATERQNGDMVK